LDFEVPVTLPESVMKKDKDEINVQKQVKAERNLTVISDLANKVISE